MLVVVGSYSWFSSCASTVKPFAIHCIARASAWNPWCRDCDSPDDGATTRIAPTMTITTIESTIQSYQRHLVVLRDNMMWFLPGVLAAAHARFRAAARSSASTSVSAASRGIYDTKSFVYISVYCSMDGLLLLRGAPTCGSYEIRDRP